MKLKFWGTRGSIPVTGLNHCKYGGNTPSIEISVDNETCFIFDAGSGIRKLGVNILKNNSQRRIFLFLSHFHTDHIIGLPFFLPFYYDNYEIEIYGKPYILNSTEKIIDLILNPPLFSIMKDQLKSKLIFNNINEEFIYSNGKVTIETTQLNHPHPTLGFKFSFEGKSIVYFTDNELLLSNHSIEHTEEQISKNHKDLIEFCKNVDILIHDSSYTLNDYNAKIGWGHSSNYAAAMFAHLANVKYLYLFHYDPDYFDDTIDQILEETRIFLKKLGSKVICNASADNLEIIL